MNWINKIKRYLSYLTKKNNHCSLLIRDATKNNITVKLIFLKSTQDNIQYKIMM